MCQNILWKLVHSRRNRKVIASLPGCNRCSNHRYFRLLYRSCEGQNSRSPIKQVRMYYGAGTGDSRPARWALARPMCISVRLPLAAAMTSWPPSWKCDVISMGVYLKDNPACVISPRSDLKPWSLRPFWRASPQQERPVWQQQQKQQQQHE